MSERKTKQQNKVLQANVNKTKNRSPKGIYVVMVVIIGIVLGLAAKTIYDENVKRHPKTVEQWAQYKENVSTEEFMKLWGLEGKPEITKDTDIDTALAAMPIAKYVEFNIKYNDNFYFTTYEDFMSAYNFREDMPEETVTFEEAYNNYKRVFVSDYARDEGITVEEYLTKYKLNEMGITGETEMSQVMGLLPVEKYAELNNTTIEALREEYGFIDPLPEGTTFSDAVYYVTMEKAAEMEGKTYEQYLEEDCYGLTEAELPRDMLMSDAMPLIEEAYNALVAANEAAAAAEAETADTTTDTATDAAAPAEGEVPVEGEATTPETETVTE